MWEFGTYHYASRNVKKNYLITKNRFNFQFHIPLCWKGRKQIGQRLIVMFLSTEIFSKRRKIYAWYEEKPELIIFQSVGIFTHPANTEQWCLRTTYGTSGKILIFLLYSTNKSNILELIYSFSAPSDEQNAIAFDEGHLLNEITDL
mgnify:CR=1 FL=1